MTARGLPTEPGRTASDATSGGIEHRPGKTASDATSGGIVFGGAQWTTLIDYPGRVAAAVFTIGCNFRCPFCHNPELVDPDRLAATLDEGEVLDRLRERVGFIDGVVISGGEPTIQPSFPSFVERVKRLGLLVKLDTNGSHPDVLHELLEEQLADYIAMDVKGPPDAYERFTGGLCDLDAIERAIDLIVERAPDYEFRTTVAPLLGREDVLRIADRLSGAKRYVLQAFRVPEKGLVDPAWETRPSLSRRELDGLWSEIRSCFADGGVRG
jgi:pyruvate formate lyase activating enzyme